MPHDCTPTQSCRRVSRCFEDNHKSQFGEDVFCVPIFRTLKLIVALLPYFQVLLSSNNWTNPNKNYWDCGASLELRSNLPGFMLEIRNLMLGSEIEDD